MRSGETEYDPYLPSSQMPVDSRRSSASVLIGYCLELRTRISPADMTRGLEGLEKLFLATSVR
jgi:hypothetical protein